MAVFCFLGILIASRQAGSANDPAAAWCDASYRSTRLEILEASGSLGTPRDSSDCGDVFGIHSRRDRTHRYVRCTTPKMENHPEAEASSHCNIIVIMADDVGYGDLSCYGANAIATPHLDALAASGIRFTNGYCSASTCTPTRYSFLTGNYAFREKGTGIAPPNAPSIIKPGTPTIASMLHDAGYATMVVGKWHLGLGGPSGPDWNGELKPGPLEIGFDHCFLLPTTNDRVPQVFVQDHRVKDLDPQDPLWVGNEPPSADHPTGKSHRSSLRMDWTQGHNGTIHNGISRIGYYTGGWSARFRDEDLADAWVEQSKAFLEADRQQPFFLFFAPHDIHVPRMPHERFQGKSSLGFRGDCILELDWCVGEIVRTLREKGLLENTLIVFCSDNGPVLDDGYRDGALERIGTHRAAGPFTGGKYSVYEGGTRTPFLVSWPSRVLPKESDAVVCTIDLAASFAKLVGQSLPTEGFLDSLDVLDALLGKDLCPGRDHLVQQDNGSSGSYGFRFGKWKLIRSDKKSAYHRIVEAPLQSTPIPQYQLFDLSVDPSEGNDLLADEPEIAANMIARLQSIIERGRTRIP